ncbi:MAG: AsmA family protein [Inquilinaceae bacterium]
MSALKKILIGLAAVIVTLVAIALILPFFIPVDFVKQRVVAEVERRTGRAFAIDGPVQLSLLPSVTVSLEDVSLANATGSRAEAMIELGQLDLEVALFPLFSRELEIQRLILREPVIALEIDEEGRPNWMRYSVAGEPQGMLFADPDAADAAVADPATETADGDAAPALAGLTLGDLGIVDGQVTYYNAVTGERIDVADIDVSVALPDLNSSFEASGSVSFNERPLTFDASALEPRALLFGAGPGDTGSAAMVSIESEVVTALFDGDLALGGEPRAVGALTLSVPSTAGLMDWLGPLLPAGSDPGGALPVDSLAFTGDIDAAPAFLVVENGELTVDETSASGNLTVTLDGPRPAVVGVVDIGIIDLDRFLNAAATVPSTPTLPAEEPAATVEPETDGTAAPETAGPDLSPLFLADVNLTLRLAGVSVRGADIGASVVGLSLADGQLTAQTNETAMFGGTAAINAVFNAAAEAPRFGIEAVLNRIEIGPALATMAGQSDVGGTLTADIDLSGRGLNRPAIAESLTGRASINLSNGRGTIPAPTADASPIALTNVDVTLDVRAIDGPLTSAGSLRLRDRSLSYSATVGNLRSQVAGSDSPVRLAVTSDLGALSFDGTAAAAAQPSATGQASLNIASIAALIDWIGIGPLNLPIDRLTYEGDLAASPVRIALEDFDLTADTLRADGTVTMTLDGPRPAIAGQVALGETDFDTLIPPAADAEAAPVPDAGGTAGGAPAGETIDLSALRTADVDLTVDSAGGTVRGVEFGPTTATILLQDGVLDLRTAEIGLFGGTAAVDIGVDSAADLPTYRIDLQAAGIQAEPLLLAVAETDRLSGTSNVTLSVTSAGRDRQAILARLDGDGAVAFRDGAVKGVNLAALIRNVGTGFLAGGEARSTDFAELSSTFAITGGLLQTDDLQMLAPLFRIEGTGEADLAAQTLNMRLVPRLVADIEGQGGQFDRSGLLVPVLVGGTFQNPTFQPDLSGLVEDALSDPQALIDRVEGLGGDAGQVRELLGGADPEAALGSLLQGLTGDRGAGTEGETDGTDPLSGLLQGLTGRGSAPAPAESQEQPAPPGDPTQDAAPPAETPATTPEGAVGTLLQGLTGGEAGDSTAQVGGALGGLLGGLAGGGADGSGAPAPAETPADAVAGQPAVDASAPDAAVRALFINGQVPMPANKPDPSVPSAPAVPPPAVEPAAPEPDSPPTDQPADQPAEPLEELLDAVPGGDLLRNLPLRGN